MRKDTAAAMKNVADDYTEFNSDFLTRLDGKAISARLSEAQAGGSGSLVAAEMTNEKVQVYGDVAILTYNFAGVSKNKDGETETTRAKSTRVSARPRPRAPSPPASTSSRAGSGGWCTPTSERPTSNQPELAGADFASAPVSFGRRPLVRWFFLSEDVAAVPPSVIPIPGTR